MMSDQDGLKQKLLEKIKARRTGLNAYAGQLETRGIRMTNLSIIFTAVTAALTAGPALGGTKFTSSASSFLGLASDAVVWQFLCLLAVVLSIAAAIINNMNKSTDSAGRLAKAQSIGLLLEKLEMSLEFDQVTVDDAAKQYQEFLAQAPFIPETSP
jgi:predicted ATPase